MSRTVSGLAISRINSAITIAVPMIYGNLCGKDNNPSKKKITIWDNPVTPSKNGIISFLFRILLFPIRIPKR